MNDWLERPLDDIPLGPYEVEVRMLADKVHVPGVRALASDMAIRQDFDLDTVEDLRLALEEACATLVANADEHGMLVCRLLISPSAVEISASVPMADGQLPVVGPFSLRILRVLSDSVDFWTTWKGNQRHFLVQLTTFVNQ